MSMSMHVVGFRAPDAKWKKMKAIYDSCREGGVDPPEEVGKFFGYVPPDERGVEVKIEGTGCCEEWDDDNTRSGFQIDLGKLPKDLTHIRFYNSW